MKIFNKAILILLTFLFVGCGDNEKNSEIGTLESKLDRNINVMVDIGKLKTFAANNNKFSFSIFRKLNELEKDNIYFSPYSISKSLATIYVGADNESREEIALVANFYTSSNSIHKIFNALDLEINYVDINSTFNVTNAMWLQKGTPVLDSYLNNIQMYYGEKIRTVDYANRPKEAKNAINTWVNAQNEHKIENIISENKINKDTQFSITNTATFKSMWYLVFLKENTKTEMFIALDGAIKQTSFMIQDTGCSNHLYYRGSNYQIISLPLWGLYKEKVEGFNKYFSRSNMIIVLPDEGEYYAVMENMESIYSNKKENMLRHNTIIKIPKFSFQTRSYNIKQHLKNMGIKRIFENNKSLNDISNNNLKINHMLHKASIEVDEGGVNKSSSVYPPTAFTCVRYSDRVPFTANRPFVFFIQNTKTDQILFMGTIKNL